MKTRHWFLLAVLVVVTARAAARGFADGKYSPASSLMQFRNISIKEL